MKNLAPIAAAAAVIALLGLDMLILSAGTDSHVEDKPVNGYHLHWERMNESIYTSCDAKQGNRLYQDINKGDIAVTKDDTCKG